ncbi:MAG: hypothetical protein IPH75_14850 [bacterium]|nr:hypothetical protein [bacterium]
MVRFIGFGDVILDHVFRNRGTEVIYLGSQGGGPVWNMLCNLSRLGSKTKAIGVAGKDSFGKFAITELKQLGVDTEDIKSVEGKRTRIIFQHNEEAQPDLFSGPAHSFSSRCLICEERSVDDNLALVSSTKEATQHRWDNFDVLCMDRISRDRTVLVDDAARAGVASVLDLGQINYLRWIPTARSSFLLIEISNCTDPVVG